MTMNMESLFWLTNKEWYRVNEEKDCFEILDFAPEEAKTSFEIWSGKSKKEEIDTSKLNCLREKISEWKK